VAGAPGHAFALHRRSDPALDGRNRELVKKELHGVGLRRVHRLDVLRGQFRAGRRWSSSRGRLTIHTKLSASTDGSGRLAKKR
jgi:hypothetical protein